MSFKAKLRKIGNSQGVYIPTNVITGYNIGDIVELEVITSKNTKVITPDIVITKKGIVPKKVITPKKVFNTTWCSKHDAMKGSCGCK